MNRRHFIKSGSALVSVLPLARFLPDEKPYKITTLRKDVGIYSGRGGTIGWHYNEENIVIVDTQFPEYAGYLKEEIRAKTTRPIDLLINTHHHGDHTAGNKTFSDMVEESVAHENSVKNQKASAEKRNTTADQFYPTTTFTESWSKQLASEKISMHYFGPAHTNGDSVIHFEEANIVHMGDLMFNGRHPFIDKSTGASIENWIKLLATVRNKFDSDTLFIFGHASDPEKVTGGKEDLANMESYLSAVLETVSSRIKSGQSADQIMKITSIHGFEHYDSNGIERSLQAALAELEVNK
jgi:glyoxylase-like metal-dependent hydrolase (beta-lactamase superfamily II)